MKKLIKLSLMLVAAAMLSTSCNCYKKMGKNIDDVNVSCSPEILTLNNGEVPVELSVKIPAKYFNKKAIVRVTPVVVYEGGEVTAKPIMLQGSKVTENYKVVDYTNGADLKETVVFKYKPEMRRGQMQLRIEVTCKCTDCGDFMLIDPATMAPITKAQMETIAANPNSAEAKAIVKSCGFPVAEGVNTLQEDMKYANLMKAMQDNYKRVTTTIETADLSYGISSSVVNSKALKSESVKSLKELTAANTENDRATQTIYANGYASPDGPEKFNDKLSKARSESAQKAITKLFKEFGLTIDAASYGEDWDGFKKLVEESSIEDKNLILQVLSLHDSSTQREQEIKNLSAVFSELKSEVLPQLRRAQISNKVDLQGKTDEEMLELVKAQRYNDLNEEEVLHICAKLKVTLKDKAALLEYAAKKFDSMRAYNNLAVVYALMGNNKKADEALEASIKCGAKGAATNKNLAMMSLENGDVAGAEKFSKSGDAQTTAAIAAAKGDYTPATKSMKGYNAAVAYTQMGNYTEAKSALGKDKSADAEYLRAVIASREGDVKSAATSLDAAIKKNKNLSKKAATDVNLKNLLDSGYKL